MAGFSREDILRPLLGYSPHSPLRSKRALLMDGRQFDLAVGSKRATTVVGCVNRSLGNRIDCRKLFSRRSACRSEEKWRPRQNAAAGLFENK